MIRHLADLMSLFGAYTQAGRKETESHGAEKPGSEQARGHDTWQGESFFRTQNIY